MYGNIEIVIKYNLFCSCFIQICSHIKISKNDKKTEKNSGRCGKFQSLSILFKIQKISAVLLKLSEVLSKVLKLWNYSWNSRISPNELENTASMECKWINKHLDQQNYFSLFSWFLPFCIFLLFPFYFSYNFSFQRIKISTDKNWIGFSFHRTNKTEKV